MPTHQEKVDNRKGVAQGALQRAVVKGKRFQGPAAIKGYLHEYALECDWGQDYFQILTDGDYSNVYIEVLHELAATSTLRRGTGETTPPPSDASSPPQSELLHSGPSRTENSLDGGKEAPRPLLYRDSVGYCRKSFHQGAC